MRGAVRHVACPSLVVSRTLPLGGGEGLQPRTCALRADRLTALETHVVDVMRSSLRLSTEAVLDSAQPAWLARYAGLFDVVNLPYSHPDEWARVSADARRVRSLGLRLHVRTLVTRGGSATDMSAPLSELAPCCWTLVPEAGLSAGDLHSFMALNAPALESVPEVQVLWDSGRTRFPRRSRRGMASNLLD